MVEGQDGGLADALGEALRLLQEFGVGYGLDDRNGGEVDVSVALAVDGNEAEAVGFELLALVSSCGGVDGGLVADAVDGDRFPVVVGFYI